MAIPLNGSSFEAPRYDAPVVRIPWSIPGYAFAGVSVAAMFRLAIPPLEMIALAPGNVAVYALSALRLLPDQPVGGAAVTLGIAVLVSGLFWTMAGVAGWNVVRQFGRETA